MIKRGLVLALLAIFAFAAAGRLQAQEGPSLVIDPPSQTVALEDGPFDVRLMVDDVTTDQGLGGYTLVLIYDPAVIQGLTITDSGYVASTENAVLCPASAIDNEAGRLAHFCFTIPILSQPGPQITEPQVLVTIRFEPVAEGTTILDLSETTLIDPQGNGLAATTADGEVTVGERAADPSPAEDTESPEVSLTENERDAALPITGDGPDGGTNWTRLLIALIVSAIGSAGVIAAVVTLRMRRRVS